MTLSKQKNSEINNHKLMEKSVIDRVLGRISNSSGEIMIKRYKQIDNMKRQEISWLKRNLKPTILIKAISQILN